MNAQDPYLDPDDAEIDFSALSDTWRKYRRLIQLITAAAVVAVGGYQTWRYLKTPRTFQATQQVRFNLDNGEFRDGAPFRLADLTRQELLARVHASMGLGQYLSMREFTAQMTAYGVRTGNNEYALRYQVERPEGIPEFLVPKVLNAVLTEWGRDVLAARGGLGHGSLFVPQPLALSTNDSLLVRSDTARRQLQRYLVRLIEIGTRSSSPTARTVETGESLPELRQRVEDLLHSELEPIILVACRLNGLSDADRRFLDSRLLDRRLAVAEQQARAALAEQLAGLKPLAEGNPALLTPSTPAAPGAVGKNAPQALVVPGVVLPGGGVTMTMPQQPSMSMDASLLQQMYDLGKSSNDVETRRKAINDLRDARRLEAEAEREVRYYESLLAAASAPRMSSDPAAVEARFGAFQKDVTALGTQVSTVARRILDREVSIENVDYFLGLYSTTISENMSSGIVIAWTVLTLILTPLIAFVACFGWHLRHRRAAGSAA